MFPLAIVQPIAPFVAGAMDYQRYLTESLDEVVVRFYFDEDSLML